MNVKIKRTVFRTVVISALLHGMETWPAKTEQDKELGVAKMHTHSLGYFRQLQYDTLVDVIARKLHNIIDDPCHNYVNIELSM